MPQFTVHHERKAGQECRQELGGRNCSRDHRGMQWCLLACLHGLLSLLIETETTSLGVAPPTVDCPSYINHYFHRPV